MTDGALTKHDRYHDRIYAESVINGNSGYWRGKVQLIGDEFVKLYGQPVYFAFIDSLPNTVTYADIFYALERKMECTCNPLRNIVCPACQEIIKHA